MNQFRSQISRSACIEDDIYLPSPLPESERKKHGCHGESYAMHNSPHHEKSRARFEPSEPIPLEQLIDKPYKESAKDLGKEY